MDQSATYLTQRIGTDALYIAELIKNLEALQKQNAEYVETIARLSDPKAKRVKA